MREVFQRHIYLMPWHVRGYFTDNGRGDTKTWFLIKPFWIYIPWSIKTQQTKRMKANFYLNANKFVKKFWNLPFFQWSSHNQNKKDYLQLKENHKFGRREVGVYNRWDYWSKKFGTNLSPALDVGINLGALQIRTFF